MDNSSVASGPGFRICPLCEASKLVFSGLHEARCPTCGYEPSDVVLKTLREIVSLPEVPEPREAGLYGEIRRSPKKGSNEQEGAESEQDRRF